MNEGASLLGKQTQLAAIVMLTTYAAAFFIMLPRELRFLREADQPYRQRFAVLDVLLQVFIIATLLPCALAPQLTLQTIRIVLAAFTGLWIVVLAIAYLRYVYTYHILLSTSRRQVDQAVRLMNDKIVQESQQNLREGGQHE